MFLYRPFSMNTDTVLPFLNQSGLSQQTKKQWVAFKSKKQSQWMFKQIIIQIKAYLHELLNTVKSKKQWSPSI